MSLGALIDGLGAEAAPVGVLMDRGGYVYGAGGFGRRLVREIQRVGGHVLGFIDVTGRDRPSVDGLPCHHPDDLGDVTGTAYIHGLMNHRTPADAVLDWAGGRGFSALCFPSALYALPGFTLEHYWLAPAERTLACRDALAAFEDALEDEESRRLLRRLLAYRLSGDPRRHPEVDLAGAYRPAFLPIAGQPLTFIDGGAYTGDTLEDLLAAGIAIRDWIAFEPDLRNMAALRATAARHRGALGSYTLIRAGLSDRSGTLRFAEGGGAASRLIGPDEPVPAESTVTEVEVVRLDDMVARPAPVYVKLDIEGAELDALRGMPDLLGQRPLLAISLYHRPADLWEIPRLVADLYDRPRLRLRQHGHHGFDTVLYVMPG